MARVTELDFGTAEFIEKIKARDNEAVESLVASYTDRLNQTALSLGFDSSAAEELVQSVWVTFFEVAPRFQSKSQIKTFIFGILYNKSLEIRRREKREFPILSPPPEGFQTLFDSKGQWVQAPMDPEKFLLSLNNVEVIQSSIEELPHLQRAAFVLKEIEDLSTEEVCNILNISATHLGVVLFRARNHLRKKLEEFVKP